MREIGTVPDMNCQALGVGDSPHFPGRPERDFCSASLRFTYQSNLYPQNLHSFPTQELYETLLIPIKLVGLEITGRLQCGHLMRSKKRRITIIRMGMSKRNPSLIVKAQ